MPTPYINPEGIESVSQTQGLLPWLCVQWGQHLPAAAEPRVDMQSTDSGHLLYLAVISLQAGCTGQDSPSKK